MTCKHCGAEDLSQDFDYCPFCGEYIRELPDAIYYNDNSNTFRTGDLNQLLKDVFEEAISDMLNAPNPLMGIIKDAK